MTLKEETQRFRALHSPSESCSVGHCPHASEDPLGCAVKPLLIHFLTIAKSFVGYGAEKWIQILKKIYRESKDPKRSR